MSINATDTKTLVANICAKATVVSPTYEVVNKARRLANYIGGQLAHAAEHMGSPTDDSVISFGVTELGNMVIIIDEDAATQMYGKTAELIGRPFARSFFHSEKVSQLVCDTLMGTLGGHEIRIFGHRDTAQLTCIMVILTTNEDPVYDEQHLHLDADWVADAACKFVLSCF